MQSLRQITTRNVDQHYLYENPEPDPGIFFFTRIRIQVQIRIRLHFFIANVLLLMLQEKNTSILFYFKYMLKHQQN